MEGFQKGDIISQYRNGHLQTSFSIAKYHSMSYDRAGKVTSIPIYHFFPDVSIQVDIKAM